MSWEWPETYPLQALRAGAVAVKQFGWYHARNWRGGKTAERACYDVKDTSADQIYRPETRSAGPKQLAAVVTTWNLSIRRTRNGTPGYFILTGYAPGSIATCGAEKNGYRLYQKGVKACAKAGLTYEQIARIYYGSTLQLTDPGRHNIAGRRMAAVTPARSCPPRKRVDVHVRASTGAGFTAPATPDAHPTSDDATLGRVSADIDGDGDDELVSLVSDGPTSQHIEVRQAAGYRYGEPIEGLGWDFDAAGVAFVSDATARPAVQLLTGRFRSDTTTILRSSSAATTRGPAASSAALQSRRPSRPSPSLRRYLRPASSRAFAGDVTGDNRADIVLQTPIDGGLAYRVRPRRPRRVSSSRHPGDLVHGHRPGSGGTKAILLDYDRDSRDDLVLAIDAASGTVYRGLRSTGRPSPRPRSSARRSAFDRVKLATSDVNRDGRGDVVVYAKLPGDAAGTRLYVYRSTGTALAAAEMWLEDASLDWQTVEPY